MAATSGTGGGGGYVEALDNSPKVPTTEQSNYELPPAYIENNVVSTSFLLVEKKAISAVHKLTLIMLH